MMDNNSIGISAFATSVPPYRVDLRQWCEWSNNSWDKTRAVIGESFRVPGVEQDVYTMAANAMVELIVRNDIDPRRIGYLALGTESSIDNATGAVIVRGWSIACSPRAAWRVSRGTAKCRSSSRPASPASTA